MRTRLNAVKGGDLRENNIKVDLGEIIYADVASVCSEKEGAQWRKLVIAVTKL
jgi:hypothetical protein